MNSGEKSIIVRIILEQKQNSFMFICDNGHGMNEVELKAFATYALSPEARGQTDHDISKFGVGKFIV